MSWTFGWAATPQNHYIHAQIKPKPSGTPGNAAAPWGIPGATARCPLAAAKHWAIRSCPQPTQHTEHLITMIQGTSINY